MAQSGTCLPGATLRTAAALTANSFAICSVVSPWLRRLCAHDTSAGVILRPRDGLAASSAAECSHMRGSNRKLCPGERRRCGRSRNKAHFEPRETGRSHAFQRATLRRRCSCGRFGLARTRRGGSASQPFRPAPLLSAHQPGRNEPERRVVGCSRITPRRVVRISRLRLP